MVLLFYMSPDVPVHQYTCSVCFFFFGITCTMTFQLIYWGTYTHRSTRKYIYLFTFMLFFRLTTKPTCHHNYLCTCTYMYPFMTLPVHVHTVIPINRLDLPANVSTALHVHRCTCSSVYQFKLFLHFRYYIHSYFSTHLLGYVYTDPHASPLPKNKDVHVTTTTCVPALKCTRSWSCLFMFIL